MSVGMESGLAGPVRRVEICRDYRQAMRLCKCRHALDGPLKPRIVASDRNERDSSAWAEPEERLRRCEFASMSKECSRAVSQDPRAARQGARRRGRVGSRGFCDEEAVARPSQSSLARDCHPLHAGAVARGPRLSTHQHRSRPGTGQQPIDKSAGEPRGNEDRHVFALGYRGQAFLGGSG